MLNIRALTSENRYIFLSYIIEYSTCFYQKPLSPSRGSCTKPWYSAIVYSVVLWEWCSTCSTVSPGVKSPPAQPRDDKVCVECNFVFGKNQEGSLQWRKCSPDWKSLFSCGQSRHFIRIIPCQTGHRENILMASQDDKESESTNDLECWGLIWQTTRVSDLMFWWSLSTHMCWAWAWYSLPSLSAVSTVWESVSVVSSVPVLSVELGLVPDLNSGLNNFLKMKRWV